MKYSFDQSDPLTLAMAPPPNETTTERVAREGREEHARAVSKRIDAELKLAKAMMKKKQRAIKVLVLGQSLSGKSTTIKNFQMTYAQKSWAEERESWKAVILFNLVRSVNIVVDILAEEIGIARGVRIDQTDGVWPTPCADLTEDHISLALKLAPLRQLEQDLKNLLGAASLESDDLSHGVTKSGGQRALSEFALRSGSGWRTVLDHIRNPSTGKGEQLLRVVCDVILDLRNDVLSLWADPVVQKLLRKRLPRLEDMPGFFLLDVDRIARRDYIPSDVDVVRARLRTTGVQEYHFTLDQGTSTPRDWLMYDVAGIRTSRAAWIPYFRDITAIIFLAPLSAFDETLAEDSTINCIYDTFSLWKTICSSKLLAKVQIILFMNKTDILQAKLESGLMVRDYLPEYRETSNDFSTVTIWFHRVFSQIYKNSNSPNRKLISHFTSVIDTKSTAKTLAAVHSVILENAVVEAGLM